MTQFNKIRSLTLLLMVTAALVACGVKKSPTPAYTFPSDPDRMMSPSPTPGFSNPSGPLTPGNDS